MNKGMKWSSAVLAASILLGGTSLTAATSTYAAASEASAAAKQSAQQPSIALKYNGKTLAQQGKALNGNTMIPLTVLRDTFGYSISYNSATRTYTAGSGSVKLNLEVSEHGVAMNLNGYYLYSNNTNDEAKILDGRLYVPFKLLNDYLGFQGVYNPTQKSLDISKRVMNDIRIASESLNKSNTNASIEISYPKVSGLAEDAQQAINAVLKQKAESFAAASEKQAGQRDGKVEREYAFLQNYAVTFNREGVLSLVIDQYSYTGGAHGITMREGLTFSLKDGKQIELGDLLKAAPNYKQTLDGKLKEKIKKEPFEMEAIGLKEKPDFYVKEGGLAIFYQQYEIAPYAAGFPTYTFTFGELLPKGANPFAAVQ